MVYPVEYGGVMDHVRDSVVFQPVYEVRFLHDDERASERVSVDKVLREYAVPSGEWNYKFEEKAIETALRNRLGGEVAVQFVYRTPVISPKSVRMEVVDKASPRLLAERRRKKRRVICDSDSDD